MSEKEQSDPRYRKYVQLIERNLQSFDAVNEWADIISFLGRLLKSFQAYPQFRTIPHKHIVAKRLAQCLNPGFPAGVHQKTLEVYAYILETIGREQLAKDLPLWSIGLFPFVQYAATHVKPQLLNIIEKFYYPLGVQLRPAFRGLIIALLPALEEEGSEGFDKVVAMLDRLQNVAESPFFYACFWLVMINDDSLRAPALNYLLRRLPKITNKEDVALVLGGPENVALMIRAFAATLKDPNLLVQRGMLELLVQNYVLRFRTLAHDDLVTLTRSALSIVLRKDMSLNRRLYAWLLGTDTNAKAQLQYFHQFAEPAVIQAMRGLFHSTYPNSLKDVPEDDYATMIVDAQKPYKVLISLMDKWELGQPIVNRIFVDSLVSLYNHANHGLPEQEILQTANMWMEMVEPYMIWKKLYGLLDQMYPPLAAEVADKGAETLNLIEYTLHAFKFTDDDIRQMHLPLVIIAMAQTLKTALDDDNFMSTLRDTAQYIDIMVHILHQLPDLVYSDRQRKASIDDTSTIQSPEMEFHLDTDPVTYARTYYQLGDGRHRRSSTREMLGFSEDIDHNDGDLTSLAHQPAPALASENGHGDDLAAWMTLANRPTSTYVRGYVFKMTLTTYLIDFLVSFIRCHVALDITERSDVTNKATSSPPPLEKILHDMGSALIHVTRYWNEKEDQMSLEPRKLDLAHCLLMASQSSEFGVVDTSLSLLTQLMKNQFLDANVLKNPSVMSNIMDKLWSFLGPSTQLLHMRTVELIWLVTDAGVAYHVEQIMAKYLIVTKDVDRLASYEKFGVFWELSENMQDTASTFTRPMFIMLDLLREGSSPLDRRAGDSWIRCHLKSYGRLLQPFMTTLLSPQIIRRSVEKTIPYEYQQLYPAAPSMTPSPASIRQPPPPPAVIVPYYLYMRPFDMDIVDYILTTLNTLIRYGGMSVLKACKNYAVGAANNMAALIEQSLGITAQDCPHLNFLELLVHIGIRLIESEPCEKLHPRMIKPVRRIQLHACDMLYLIISKLDMVDMTITSMIQYAALSKLLFCIASGDLDIQQKLLHLVQATMAITAAHATSLGKSAHTQRRSSVTYGPEGVSSTWQANASHAAPSATSTSTNTNVTIPTPSLTTSHLQPSGHSTPSSPIVSTGDIQQDAVILGHDTCNLYLKCVMDAFHTPNNRALLTHWMDFVLVTLPHLRQAFRQVMMPLLALLCEQVYMCNETVRLLMHGGTVASTPGNKPPTYPMASHHHPLQQKLQPWAVRSQETLPLIQEQGAVMGGPEADILVFLNGLEKLLMMGLLDRSVSDMWTGGASSRKQPVPLTKLPLLLPCIDDQLELYGLSQWMKQHYHQRPDQLQQQQARQVLLLQFPLLLHLLLDVWRVFRQPHWASATVRVMGQAKKEAVWQSFAFAADHVKARLESSFEFLYKHFPVDVIEAFVEIFYIENPVALECEAPTNVYKLDVLEILSAIPTSSSQQVLAILLDSIRQRSPGIQHRRRTITRQGKLTDTALLRFAEIYCQAMVKPEALASLWPLIHPFAKEYLSQASSYKLMLPGLLRLLTVGLTSFMKVSEDKKMRKEAQDLYQRCVDYCILLAGRSFDQGLWLRRTALYDDDDGSSSTHTSPYAMPSTNSSTTTANTMASAQHPQNTLATHPTLSSTAASASSLGVQDLAGSPQTSPSSTTSAVAVIASATAMVTAAMEGSIMPLFGYTLGGTTGDTTTGERSAFKTTTNSDSTTITPVLSEMDAQGYHPSLLDDHATATAMDTLYPRNLSLTQVPDLERLATWKAKEEFLILHLNHYLAERVLPHLRVLLGGDQDRVNAVLANLVYYVIGPTLRSRQGSMLASPATTFRFGRALLHGPSLVLDQVVAMAHMPFTYKTWRKDMWDAFNDSKFFLMASSNAHKWCQILTTVFTIEKDRFLELLGKINTAAIVSSGAFPFTSSNRDHDTLMRALQLRRLSFVLYAGHQDQYVPQLPLIQEKLVDLLKLDHGEAVHVDIYLCLRILLLRFSQKHLVNFWPVLISELMRLFSSYLTSLQDRPEEATIALAGCKFLDLVCTLELDSFQVYQWMFICDTIDVMIKQQQDMDDCMAMIDKLDAKLMQGEETKRETAVSTGLRQELVTTFGGKRRPMLTMTSISSIQQLRFFVEHVSANAYQSSYMLCKPDIPFIEDLLLHDLIDLE
ncbi:hypothetical protein DM01DRAFT_1314259 [Hesseltinella vesiculosa]|uniref:Uncharacterized protein n=1 Tax=Hesseltinella vesiculosa TaxID=101127 RepID=A0A1X2GXE0_9FUNG|nr:hypothetical protein DM01DRAFT_1314259 [Hesseltinella vesiculosa]